MKFTDGALRTYVDLVDVVVWKDCDRFWIRWVKAILQSIRQDELQEITRQFERTSFNSKRFFRLDYKFLGF